MECGNALKERGEHDWKLLGRERVYNDPAYPTFAIGWVSMWKCFRCGLKRVERS